MAVKLTWTDDTVEIYVDGDFPNQMVAVNKALRGDKRSKTIRNMLFNVLDADIFYADSGLISTLAELDFDSYTGGPQMKVAVATTSNQMADITTMYATRYKALSPNGAKFRVFDTLGAAREWLMEND